MHTAHTTHKTHIHTDKQTSDVHMIHTEIHNGIKDRSSLIERGVRILSWEVKQRVKQECALGSILYLNPLFHCTHMHTHRHMHTRTTWASYNPYSHAHTATYPGYVVRVGPMFQ